jgi:hypothetical protein
MEKLSIRRSVPGEGPSKYTEALFGALIRINLPCSRFHSSLFASTLQKMNYALGQLQEHQ